MSGMESQLSREPAQNAGAIHANVKGTLLSLVWYAKCPAECEKKPCPMCGRRPCVCPITEVRLSNGTVRKIRDLTETSFWHPDGTPMSARQFMEALFGKLPEFFKDEEELRALWSAPDTRKKLLDGLAEKGFGKDQLAEMQKIIDAEKSDLFDVLANVAYALNRSRAKNELPRRWR